MMPDGSLALAGLYRPLPEPPGFAIPVFRDGAGRLVAQEAGADGRIAGFARCQAETSTLLRVRRQGRLRSTGALCRHR
jgi:hypothetical protein